MLCKLGSSNTTEPLECCRLRQPPRQEPQHLRLSPLPWQLAQIRLRELRRLPHLPQPPQVLALNPNRLRQKAPQQQPWASAECAKQVELVHQLADPATSCTSAGIAASAAATATGGNAQASASARASAVADISASAAASVRSRSCTLKPRNQIRAHLMQARLPAPSLPLSAGTTATGLRTRNHTAKRGCKAAGQCRCDLNPETGSFRAGICVHGHGHRRPPGSHRPPHRRHSEHCRRVRRICRRNLRLSFGPSNCNRDHCHCKCRGVWECDGGGQCRCDCHHGVG